jgi:DNA-binding MarR family transcriptional regulator
VQNTPKGVLRHLHEALIDVIGVFNRPQNDVVLLREAGVSLDRALFPLLVVIQRRGPIAVGDLADRVGRDYTTVSRQVGKLEALGLVVRRARETDRRVTEAVVSEKGQAMSDALDAARERLAGVALAGWSEDDLESLAQLMRRFADSLTQGLGDPHSTPRSNAATLTGTATSNAPSGRTKDEPC